MATVIICDLCDKKLTDKERFQSFRFEHNGVTIFVELSMDMCGICKELLRTKTSEITNNKELIESWHNQ